MQGVCVQCGNPSAGYMLDTGAGAVRYVPMCKKCPVNPKALTSLQEIFYQRRESIPETAKVLALTEQQTTDLLVTQPSTKFVSEVTRIRARFEGLRQDVEKHAREAQQLLGDLIQFQILNEDDLHLAAKITQKASSTWKSLEEQRKDYLRPLLEFTRDVNKLFKIPVDLSKEIERTGKAKMEEALETCKESQEGILSALELNPVNREQLMVRARSLEWTLPSEISLRDSWEIEIFDPDAVPREYCAPDRTKVDEAVKNGVEIPGVRARKRDKISVYREKTDG